jgi:molybdenum cofactor cytidylyltransferase
MGYPKALLPLRDGTFISRVLDTLARVELAEPRIILGRDAGRIIPSISDQQVRLLINPDPGQGQISSMKLALNDLAPNDVGCLFWPVDQPGVQEGLIRDLIRLFCASGALIALPVYEGKRGHPAIFHRSIFQELLHAPVEAGLKGVVRRHVSETALLPCNESAVAEDVDTSEDYLRLTGETVNQALRRTGVLP